MQARHALQEALPERACYRAWDLAVLHAHLSESHAAEGQADQALHAAEASIRALADAAPGQDLDVDDWLQIGDALVDAAPECLPTLLRELRSHIPAELPQPRRRSIEVRLARMEARASCRRGDIEAGLGKAREGRYALSSDEDDAFSAQMTDWLLQAGRAEEAAALAFDSVFNERPVSSDHACELALRLAAMPDNREAHWPLALAYAAGCEGLAWVCGDEAPAAFFDRQLEQARQLAPGHPAIGLLRAREAVCRRKDHAAALPWLEEGLSVPELMNSEHLVRLWLCRMRVHGVSKALRMPFAEARAAGWNYNVGVEMSFRLREQLPRHAEWPEAEVQALVARYYEAGRRQFEAFFASGRGAFKDADVHVYAMLCNNLAIHYRCETKQYARAVALHEKGLAASPFAEHHQGLLHCYEASGEHARFLDAADRLWHFAADHGYSRHSPIDYFKRVAELLAELGRDGELAIWLQRLDEWWQHFDAEGRRDNERDYLEMLVVLLAQMALTQPEDARVRLEPALPRIRALKWCAVTRIAGLALERGGHIQEALLLYREALTQTQTYSLEQQREMTREAIGRCEAAQRAARPWWQRLFS